MLDEGARLNIFDPKVEPDQIFFDLSNSQLDLPYGTIKDRIQIFSDDVLEACKHSHAIVVCTEWDLFRVRFVADEKGFGVKIIFKLF